MNVKFLIAIFAVVVSTVAGQEYIQGKLINPGPVVLRARALLQPRTCSSGAQIDCANCKTRAICSPDQNVLTTIECPVAAPYCIAGSCTSTEPASCIEAPAPSPLCPSAGMFPSPKFCNHYVVCDSNRVASEYECPLPYVYEHSSGLCRRSYNFEQDCPVIDCDKKPNQFVEYFREPSLYYFCSTVGGPVLLQCKYGQGYDAEIQGCSFLCQREGRFPVDDDETKYYLCLYTNVNYPRFNRYLEACPKGQVFSKNSSLCVNPTPPASSTPATIPTDAPDFTYTTMEPTIVTYEQTTPP